MQNTLQTVPLLQGLRQEGSTFYTFSSATNDTILLFSTGNIKMQFSKFACIKLPNWENVAKQRVYRTPTDIESINDTSSVDDANTFFTKSYLQNYVENFTSYVDADRPDENYSNFTEAGFWKAMQSVSYDGTNESYRTLQLVQASTYLTPNNITRSKFTEAENLANSYEQIVQYVGDINLMNHTKSGGREYLEVYAHVPTGHGKLSNVPYKYNDSLIANSNIVPSTPGTDWVVGQESSYLNSNASEKTYAKAIYDSVNKQYSLETDKDFLQLDWESLESDQYLQNETDNGNFEFNAVLVYYDIWDGNNESTRQRNLYGVLVLDKFTTVSPTSKKINTFSKLQPNANQSGNAFGFRFNLMFAGNTNQITSEIAINDYSTISMELYMSALDKLQHVTDTYNNMYSTLLEMSAKVNRMEQTILTLSKTI